MIGSAPLERQIRELGSDLHVFGHTHIPIDMGCEGVRYLQWSLGMCLSVCRFVHVRMYACMYVYLRTYVRCIYLFIVSGLAKS